jgi:hypothetical protein
LQRPRVLHYRSPQRGIESPCRRSRYSALAVCQWPPAPGRQAPSRVLPPVSTSMAFTVTVPQAQTVARPLGRSYPPNETPLCGGACVHPLETTRSALSTPPAIRADRTAETCSRRAGVSRSSESLIRCVTGPASATAAADSGTRSLNDWLACWFCSTPVETQGDAAAAGAICGQMPGRGCFDSSPAGTEDCPPAGTEDGARCVPHAAIRTITAQTPADDSLLRQCTN